MSSAVKAELPVWNEQITCTPRLIIRRATHLGMCFGVRDAIDMALSHPEPLTILGDLVHNEMVLNQLQRQGVQIVHQVAAISTPNVMITAHGASDLALGRLRERGLQVLQATCPLVHVAHRAVTNLVKAGYYPVIVGKRDHVEVRGMTEDLAECDVILNEEDVAKVEQHEKFGVAAQTTQPVERVRHLVELLQARFPDSEVRFIDTVCQPTKQRQRAAIELAEQSDVVIVIGGAHSNNTRELVQTCAQFCRRVHHIQGPEDLCAEWFQDIHTVGITAGTSTPDTLIDAVEHWIQELNH